MTENKILDSENITNACDGAEETQSTAEDIRDEVPEKTFTQSQLEALISERLKRERKNAEALRSVKDLLTNLSNSGTLKSSSYSDMASELSKLLSEKKDKAEENAVTVGGTHSALEENKNASDEEDVPVDTAFDANAENNALPEEEPVREQKKKSCKDSFVLTADMARAIKKAYPQCDIGELLCDGLFEAFSKGKSGSPEEIYGDYITFLTAIENKGEDIERRMYANTASTSFSASDKACFTDGSEGLTKRQMEIARQNGMSYREYAGLLSNIPHRAKKF